MDVVNRGGKGNPHHDEKGRFSSASKDGTVTINSETGEIMEPEKPVSGRFSLKKRAFSIKSGTDIASLRRELEAIAGKGSGHDLSKIPTLAGYDAVRERRKAEMGRRSMFGITEAEAEFIRKGMRRLIDESSFVRFFKSKRILDILDTGFVSNQLETGVCGDAACSMPSVRIGFSNDVFGTDVPKTNAHEMRERVKEAKRLCNGSFAEMYRRRNELFSPDEISLLNQYHGLEKYGCLRPGDIGRIYDSGVASYGDSQIILKKDRMMDRTTFTIDDSLNYKGDHCPLLTDREFDPFCMSDDKWYDLKRSVRNGNDPFKSVASLSRATGSRYIELQFHGDVTLDDMEGIMAPEEYWSSNDGRKAIVMMRSKGIKAYSRDWNGKVRQLA